MSDFRAYFFCNQYLAGIHPGIQSGHALDQLWSGLVETMDKHTEGAAAKFSMLREFSKNHKTWICLNGGDHEMLAELYIFMAQLPYYPDEFPKTVTEYPFTMFQEPGLNYANTAVVIILPERMYDDFSTMVGRAVLKAESDKTNPGNLMAQIPPDQFNEYLNRGYTKWELEFLKRKSLCKLAS